MGSPFLTLSVVWSDLQAIAERLRSVDAPLLANLVKRITKAADKLANLERIIQATAARK